MTDRRGRLSVGAMALKVLRAAFHSTTRACYVHACWLSREVKLQLPSEILEPQDRDKLYSY